MSFYDRYVSLCKEAKKSPTGVAVSFGIARSNVNYWKQGNVPKPSVLAALGEFFDVPVDFLVGAYPFDCWDAIDANRAGFFYYVPMSADKLRVLFGIDKADPDGASIQRIVAFISTCVSSIRATEEGDWLVELKPGWAEPAFPAPDVAEDTVSFSVIGDLAAGWDRVALEDYDAADRVEIPAHYLHGRPRSDFFCLRVKGQSMYPHYMEGDIVLIKKAPSLDHSGQVGAVRYEDYATLKKVEYVFGEDWMRLVPINPEFAPKMITGVDLEQCQVLGVPVLLIREVDNP